MLLHECARRGRDAELFRLAAFESAERRRITILALTQVATNSPLWRYQRNLRPNWTWRALVVVLVIAPAVPETPVMFLAVGGVKVIRFGVLKLARSSKLKISARNWRLRRSRSFVSLRTLKSHVARPGPVNVSRPRLP